MATIQVNDESEKLIAEQALLAFRASKQAVFLAPMGRGLEVTEAVVLEEGRKLSQVLLAQAFKAHPQTGKGG